MGSSIYKKQPPASAKEVIILKTSACNVAPYSVSIKLDESFGMHSLMTLLQH